MDRAKLIAMLAGDTAAFGTGSPAEEAQKPSGLAALFGMFGDGHQENTAPPQIQYKTTHPLTDITDQDIDRGMSAAMAVSGGGLSIKGFHGSPINNLTQILANPPTRQFDNATSQLGAFFAPKSGGAERYAGKNGKVYPADVPIENPYEMTWGEFNALQSPHKGPDGKSLDGSQWAGRAEELKAEAAKLRETLKAAGHDGVVIRRPGGDIYEMASFADVPIK